MFTVLKLLTTSSFPTQSRITAMQQTRYSDKSLVTFIACYINDNCLMLSAGHSGCFAVNEVTAKWTRYSMQQYIVHVLEV